MRPPSEASPAARRPIVAGNWKMFGSRQRVRRFCAALREAPPDAEVQLLIFPPLGYLAGFADGLSGFGAQLGAQNLHEAAEGAYTGETSGAMIRDLGGRWALVGHSERRAGCGESDQAVAAKFAAALQAGLSPLLCVGETLAQREAGEARTVVARQLGAALNGQGAGALGRAAIAYEPVWAIGTGRAATPEQAQEMHAFIRAALGRADEAQAQSARILYGGSVKPENAAQLFAQPDIDGGLVGGACLEPGSFLAIAAAASQARREESTT